MYGSPHRHDVPPDSTLEHTDICDHLIAFHVDEYNACGVWIGDAVRRTRGRTFNNDDASVVSFRCRGPGVCVAEGTVAEVGVATGRTTTTGT